MISPISSYIICICRWKFIVHGGVDGFSRLVVFLNLSYNNRADTVLKYFQQAVSKWGIPAGVRYIIYGSIHCKFVVIYICFLRSVHGLENIGVADFMIAAREGEPGSSFITGKSVRLFTSRCWPFIDNKG